MKIPLSPKIDLIDARITKALEKQSMYPSAIARKTKLPRTTISYRLNKLLKYKLVKNTVVGRKCLWELVYPAEKQSEVIAVYDNKNILQAYSLLFSLPKESVIWSIQGSAATVGELANIPESFIKEAHRIFKRKRIVFKGILNPTALQVFDKISKSLAESHIGRGVGLKLLDENLFKESAEIFATTEFVLITNPSKQIAIAIKDPAMISIFIGMCKSLFNLLENVASFDMNQFLRGKLGVK